ncbi:Uncharacterised protein [Anaerotruncus sp. 2789STDY5834896]|uniref:Uncharacterized protein n=1 Tax=uncultured Anaerotruncus sp. TaxID=905011 RepID=A0A1C6FQA4_9FIRM|nr:Uncharacterised protein [uncultured Anaerotruncus sp.]
MNKTCTDLLNFFENQEGWDRDEVLWGMLLDILPSDISADDVALVWGTFEQCETEDEISLKLNTCELPMTAQDFAEQLWDKIIEGVCNVIRTQEDRAHD